MFLGNLCAFSNDEFKNNYNDIYPNELKLQKENRSLFDLSVEDYVENLQTKLFDKKDACPIPLEIFCALVGLKILHILHLLGKKIKKEM